MNIPSNILMENISNLSFSWFLHSACEQAVELKKLRNELFILILKNQKIVFTDDDWETFEGMFNTFSKVIQPLPIENNHWQLIIKTIEHIADRTFQNLSRDIPGHCATKAEDEKIDNELQKGETPLFYIQQSTWEQSPEVLIEKINLLRNTWSLHLGKEKSAQFEVLKKGVLGKARDQSPVVFTDAQWDEFDYAFSDFVESYAGKEIYKVIEKKDIIQLVAIIQTVANRTFKCLEDRFQVITLLGEEGRPIGYTRLNYLLDNSPTMKLAFSAGPSSNFSSKESLSRTLDLGFLGEHAHSVAKMLQQEEMQKQLLNEDSIYSITNFALAHEIPVLMEACFTFIDTKIGEQLDEEKHADLLLMLRNSGHYGCCKALNMIAAKKLNEDPDWYFEGLRSMLQLLAKPSDCAVQKLTEHDTAMNIAKLLSIYLEEVYDSMDKQTGLHEKVWGLIDDNIDKILSTELGTKVWKKTILIQCLIPRLPSRISKFYYCSATKRIEIEYKNKICDTQQAISDAQVLLNIPVIDRRENQRIVLELCFSPSDKTIKPFEAISSNIKFIGSSDRHSSNYPYFVGIGDCFMKLVLSFKPQNDPEYITPGNLKKQIEGMKIKKKQENFDPSWW